MALWVSTFAMAQNPHGNGFPQKVEAHRVYRVFANNETQPEKIEAYNDSLRNCGMGNERGILLGLGVAIAKSYSTAFVQKTVSATSNLINLMVKLMTKNKQDREQWIKTVQNQSHFQHTLATEIFIDDFYYLPSTNGALDPMNMKFNGFGCKSSLRPSDFSHGGNLQHDQASSELLEFFAICKIRDDSVGMKRIANHSKFEIELEQFVFDTRHTCLPNDSSNGQTLKPFDFIGRKDLVFNLNVKVFSSWVNEAIMLFDNQQIGEFNITVRIDSNDLTEDRIFIYDPAKHQDKVSVSGESFIVPRSYTGTANAPSWGTGQYRLEMTVSETCSMNEQWYQKKVKKNNLTQNSKKQSQRPKWDNRKWKPEWKEIQARKKSQSVWNTMWRSITTAYIGNDWVQELVSPFSTAVSAQETIDLNNLLNIDGISSSAAKPASSVPAAAGAPMPGASTSPGTKKR